MKKNKIISLILVLFIVLAISYVAYIPKSIDTVLDRIEYPFEVGEILMIQQIEENTTVVMCMNKEKSHELQNVIIRKNGIFYSVIDNNGSLTIKKPNKLESGELRTQVLISWYDKSAKYVVMAVAYDEDVENITYRNQKLEQVNFNGYNLFYGYGIGE